MDKISVTAESVVIGNMVIAVSTISSIEKKVRLRLLVLLGLIVLNMLLFWAFYALLYWLINTFLKGSPVGEFLGVFFSAIAPAPGALYYFVPLVLTLNLTGDNRRLWKFTIRHVIQLKGSFGKKMITLDKSERDTTYDQIVGALNAAQRNHNGRA